MILIACVNTGALCAHINGLEMHVSIEIVVFSYNVHSLKNNPYLIRIRKIVN